MIFFSFFDLGSSKLQKSAIGRQLASFPKNLFFLSFTFDNFQFFQRKKLSRMINKPDPNKSLVFKFKYLFFYSLFMRNHANKIAISNDCVICWYFLKKLAFDLVPCFKNQEIFDLATI